MHTEWIAATTGLVDASSTRIRLSRFGSAIACGVPNSRMSAPPENALPAPVRTITFTAGSAWARSMPFVSPSRVARPRPLTGGLSIVRTATVPRSS